MDKIFKPWGKDWTDTPVPKCQRYIKNVCVTCHAVGVDFFCPPVSTLGRRKQLWFFLGGQGDKVVQGLNNLCIYDSQAGPVKNAVTIWSKPVATIVLKKNMWYHGIKSQSFGFNLTKGFLPPLLDQFARSPSPPAGMPWLQWCRAFATGCSKNLDFLIFRNSWTMWNPCETLPICGRELLQLEFTKAYCAYCATDGWSPISFQTCFPTAQKQWMIITHQGASPVCWYKCPWISWSWKLTKRKKNNDPLAIPIAATASIVF